MKATTSLPTGREPAGTTDSHALRRNLCWTLVGFGIGVFSASAYLLLGGEYLMGIPRGATIVFYPGFLVGFQVNAWGLNVAVSKVVGVFAVGLAYAGLATLTRLLWFALKDCLQPAALRNKPKREPTVTKVAPTHPSARSNA
jgi:hypothetical protein